MGNVSSSSSSSGNRRSGTRRKRQQPSHKVTWVWRHGRLEPVLVSDSFKPLEKPKATWDARHLDTYEEAEARERGGGVPNHDYSALVTKTVEAPAKLPEKTP